MNHIVLLGDSIFDNAIYVPGEPAVIDQLNAKLPTHWHASLGAIDGDVTLDVITQLEKLPNDATHLIISCGGNDALLNISVLNEKVATVEEALAKLATVRAKFQQDYQQMLTAVFQQNLPFAICTIYDSIPNLDQSAITALSLFNEIIIKEATRHKIPIIDLRLICPEPSDYSHLSPIEPSSSGGEKITTAMYKWLITPENQQAMNPIYS